jgi:putative peptidoglycan binding protein
MPSDYKVGDGECIGSIAHEHGLDWQVVWDHPKNAGLKKKRGNPNVVKTGDVVHLPDPEPKSRDISTGTEHRFTVKRKTAKLKLRLVKEPLPTGKSEAPPPRTDYKEAVSEDPEPGPPPEDKPQANIAYKVEIGALTIEGQTDSDGILECDIPPDARAGRVILEPGTPNETVLPLNLGHLDPIEEVSGVKQRLANLTFPCGDGDDETPELAAALRAFQEKFSLEITGALDQKTRDAIAKAYG